MPRESHARESADPFVPRRGLRNAHAQTIVSTFLPRVNLLPPPEERLFQVEPETQVLCHCHWQPDRAGALTVVIVHGLEGSAASQYVIGTGSKAWAAGMNVLRMNIRNCGGTERLGPALYHSGLSADVGAVTRSLIGQDRLQRLAVVGFSMGGNQVLKLIGEWGREAPPQVRCAVAVSPGMDLSVSADALHTGLNRLYEWHFLRSLKKRMRRKSELFPGRYELARLRRLRSMRDFDHAITAAYCGFTGADDYYARASSSRLVDRISIPTLIIHANDDPFVKILPETRARLRANPNIRYIETEHGGHCAFLADADGYDGRWAERRIVNFLREQGP